ncbi:hypothetical protein [Bifidobacterium leontopitheci]|nr:hypothetical protein [Bifidobacterium leontopitheci]
MITAAAVGIAVLIAVGGGFGYHAYAENTRQAELAQAQAECRTVAKKLESARADYRKQLESETVRAALQVTGKQVPDEDTTRSGLAKLATLDTDKPKTDANACDATGIEQVTTFDGRLKQSLATVTATTGKLDKAARKVLAAKDEKTLTDAQTGLNTKITAARKLLDSSDGKVADNTTRVKLTQAIQQAAKVKTGKNAYAMGESGRQLDATMKLVNNSINAKTKADAAERAKRWSNGSGYSHTGNGYSGYGYSEMWHSQSNSGNGNSHGNVSVNGNTSNNSGTGNHSAQQRPSSGNCYFDAEEGDSDFNDNPLICD